MGAYRYCRTCDNPQDCITVEEIAEDFSDEGISCPHCGAVREDDTPANRTRILAEAIVELKEKMT